MKNVGKYKDFDSMFAEMREEIIPAKILGKFYNVPKSIPATVALELARKAEDDVVSDRTIFKLADIVFGEETVNEWANTPGFTLKKLIEIVKWIWKIQNGGDAGEMVEVTEDDFGIEESEKN